MYFIQRLSRSLRRSTPFLVIPLSLSLLLSVMSPMAWAESSESETSGQPSTAAELPKVNITADPLGRDELQSLKPVNVLSGERLKEQLSSNLGDTLSQQVGVTSSGFGPAVGRPVIRGLSAGRIKVMQNNIDSLDLSTISPDHVVTTDTANASQIEILRGPATLLYGSGAFGGVINVVDQRIPEQVPSEFIADIELRTDSATSQRQASGHLLTGLGSQFAIYASGLFNTTDDYQVPDDALEAEHDEPEAPDELDNSDIDKDQAFTFGASWIQPWGHVGLAVSQMDKEFGLAGHSHGEEEHEEEEHEEDEEEHEHEHGEEIARQEQEQTRIDLSALVKQPFAGHEQLKFRLGFNDYEHEEGHSEAGHEEEEHEEGEEEHEEGEEEVPTLFSNEGYEARLEFLSKPYYGWRSIWGTQIEQREFSAIGEEALVPETDIQTWGLFVISETQRGDWLWEWGLRYDHKSNQPDRPESLDSTCGLTSDQFEDKDFSGVSAGLSSRWQFVSDYALSASLTRAVRLPDAEELFSCGEHESTITFDVGNPDLDEESALNWELGLHKTQGQLTGSLNLFYNQISNFIYQDFTGAEVEEFPVLLFRQEDASFQGLELALDYQVNQQLTLGWLTDWVDAELDVSGNDQPPRIPPLRYGARVDWQQQGWHLYALALRYDSQDETADFETETDGFTQLSTGVGYRGQVGSNEWRAELSGTNLLDETIRLHTSFTKDEVPQPGLGVQLRLGASF